MGDEVVGRRDELFEEDVAEERRAWVEAEAPPAAALPFLLTVAAAHSMEAT